MYYVILRICIAREVIVHDSTEIPEAYGSGEYPCPVEQNRGKKEDDAHGRYGKSNRCRVENIALVSAAPAARIFRAAAGALSSMLGGETT